MSFLFVDKIIELKNAEYIKGIKHVSLDDTYLYHEEGKARFIPSLIGETLGQLAAWNVMQALDFNFRPVAGIASGAKMLRDVGVGETIVLESFIDRVDEEACQYSSRATVNNNVVFEIASALGPMLSMDEFIAREDVINQYNQLLALDSEFGFECDGFTACSPTKTASLAKCHMVFDGVKDFIPKKSIKAVKYVNSAASYFADHFPKKPVLPMTVLLECQLNLAQDFLSQSGFFEFGQFEIKRAKMSEFVKPGESVVVDLKVKSIEDNCVNLVLKASVNNRRVCVTELSVACLEKR